MAASALSFRRLQILVLCCCSIITMVMALQASATDMSCAGVKTAMAPCVAFLKKGSPLPSASSRCCAGVKQLSSAASSGRDARQAICRCIEASAATINPLPQAVSQLPAACAIAFPYSFSLTQDCSKLQ